MKKTITTLAVLSAVIAFSALSVNTAKADALRALNPVIKGGSPNVNALANCLYQTGLMEAFLADSDKLEGYQTGAGLYKIQKASLRHAEALAPFLDDQVVSDFISKSAFC